MRTTFFFFSRGFALMAFIVADVIFFVGFALIIAVNKWDAVKDKKEALNRLNERLETSLTQVKGLKTARFGSY